MNEPPTNKKEITIMKRLITTAALFLALASSTGCSIAMALNGHAEPVMDAFEIGSTRRQVEIQLGQPVATKVLPDGNREDSYQYELGNTPNGARATLYFYYDVFSLGMTELVFTAIEAFQGHDEWSYITYYQTTDRVMAIAGYRTPPVSPVLKAAQEGQAKASAKN
jgi:hypothetical protein